MANFKEEVAKIRAFVFDVDGVLTNCQITFDSNDEPLRSYNVRDGLALVRAINKGYYIAIVSGGHGKQLQRRMESLGIKYIYLDRDQKTGALNNFSELTGVPLNEMIYMGDDYPDIAPMKMVHLCVAPADAADEVKSVVHYVSKFKGGKGCVRDIIEQVLRARGDWFEVK